MKYIINILSNRYFIIIFCITSIITFIAINNFSFDIEGIHNKPIVIQEINSDQSLLKLMSHINSDITLLTLYTSWCRSCIQKIPEINKFLENNKKIIPVMISLDENKNKLISFLQEQKKINFIPYNITPIYIKKLLYALMSKGIYFDGKIPYIAILSSNTAPITNITNINQMNTYIEKIINKQHDK
ncbi:thioredoxin family protein [Neoehrlichia mikurensis]|uniref:Thioredoxin family protein n=1 Tax=Neoehrlichia mikurensis TaxID=89586 RepID=A0A9Q9BTY1_9RICK|nr:thioredoxin-like domain-containing protein [Neoehrlichia mikurensis]QXK92243.1 thioredoxin family protein [Neoehrlichia mikurensis]QXK92698.1 thioredoxin family protein [Neoehrlichia mikurensis]QXK93936.1 thioredoxin family protein [Neoehrlichia mikurensis]UTO55902.1 thioredoxin family protein [Neoehrlichia mikurensis]UTO56818.1 thioredoxin family protein [Neoehrlichia mikurensis]